MTSHETSPGPRRFAARRRRDLRVAAGWVVLGGLLAALVVGAASFDRAGRWPGFLGDETTYLMAAQSLAWDGDLRYTRADYDRFVDQWGRRPEGLILQSTDGGRTLTFGKPAFYPAYLAPFLRVAPRRGPAVANALLLAVAALAAAAALARRAGGASRGAPPPGVPGDAASPSGGRPTETRAPRAPGGAADAATGAAVGLGPAAPWFVAAFVFASVTFAYTFWIHADLFLASLVAVALAIGMGAEGGGRRTALGWLAAGALLAVPALSRPLYLPLIPAAALAAPPGRRLRALGTVAVGALAVVAASVAVNLAVRGTWTSYGGERLGFYSYTGFPEVELPAGSWGEELARRPGSGSWVEPAKLHFLVDGRLFARDAVYFLFGRDVGVLPYFLPLVLGLVAWRRGAGRWPLAAAAVLVAACFILVRPFNFYGGGGALANRYFLPVYPALWFLAARPRSALWPLAAAVMAAPLLWPLWTAPRAFPVAPGDGFRHVSATARRWLPYETTLDHLKPTGGDDLQHQGLWIKPLHNPLAAGPDGWLAAGRPGAVELLVGSGAPLAGLTLEVAPGFRLEGVEGAGSELLGVGPGAAAYRLTPRLTARHRMWWTDDDVWLYRLELDVAPMAPAASGTGARFRLRPGSAEQPPDRPAGSAATRSASDPSISP